MLSKQEQKLLNILGYSAINLPLLMELAFEVRAFDYFNVYLNLKEFDAPLINRKLDFYNYEIVSDDNLDNALKVASNILGVTNPFAKRKVFEYFKKRGIKKIDYLNLIHPTAYVSQSVNLLNGIIVEPLVGVSSQTKIGFGVTIKRGSTVGHHNEIGDFTSINPGCVISGNVKIGRGCTIGSGAVIRDSVEIGTNTIIGVGSVVTKDIPANAIAFGSPCRQVKDNI